MSTKVKEVEEDPLDLNDDLHDDLNDLLPLRIRVEIKFRRRDSEGFRYRRMYDENVRRRIGIALKRDVFAKEKDVEFIFLRNPNWNTEVGIVATGVLMMTTDKSRVEIERALSDSESVLNLRLRDTAHEIELIEVFDSFRRFETGLRVLRVSPTAVDVRWRDKHFENENDSYTLTTYAATGDLQFEEHKMKHVATNKYLLVQNNKVRLTQKRSDATHFRIFNCESKDGTGRLGVCAKRNNKRLRVGKDRLQVSDEDDASLIFHGYKPSTTIWQEISKDSFSCSSAYRADAELGDSDSEDHQNENCYHQLSVRIQSLDPSTSYFFVLDRDTSLDFPQQSEIVYEYQHESLSRAVCEQDIVLASILCFRQERRRTRELALLVPIEPSHTLGLAPCRLHPKQRVQTVQGGQWIDAVVSKPCVDADMPDQFYDLVVTERGSSKSVVLSRVPRNRIRVSESKSSAQQRVISICGVPYIAIRSQGRDVEALYESELTARTLNLGIVALPFRTPCGGEVVLSRATTEIDSALEDARSIGGYMKFVLERRDAMSEFASKIGTFSQNGFVPPLRFESEDETMRLEIRYLNARDRGKVERLMDMFVSPFRDLLQEQEVSTIYTTSSSSSSLVDDRILVSSRPCTLCSNHFLILSRKKKTRRSLAHSNVTTQVRNVSGKTFWKCVDCDLVSRVRNVSQLGEVHPESTST